MNGIDFGLPLWVWLGIGLCALVLLAGVGISLFSFLFQAGVAINEARKPPHIDAGDYSLSQGHEVRTETDPRPRSADPPR